MIMVRLEVCHYEGIGLQYQGFYPVVSFTRRKIMVKMKFTNNQTAFEYALYMIASSYFKSADCKNKILERNMLLQYKEQKLDWQYQMEEICINYMNKLSKSLPISLAEHEVQVLLSRDEKGIVEVVLKGDDFLLILNGIYAGKGSSIRCKYITRKSPQIVNMAA